MHELTEANNDVCIGISTKRRHFFKYRLENIRLDARQRVVI